MAERPTHPAAEDEGARPAGSPLEVLWVSTPPWLVVVLSALGGEIIARL